MIRTSGDYKKNPPQLPIALTEHFLEWLSAGTDYDLAIWYTLNAKYATHYRTPIQLELNLETFKEAAVARRSFTDTLQEWWLLHSDETSCRTEQQFYISYGDRIIKALFGATTNQLKKQMGLGSSHSLKRFLTEREVMMLSMAEDLAADLIEMTMTKAQLKKTLDLAAKQAMRQTRRFGLIAPSDEHRYLKPAQTSAPPEGAPWIPMAA